MCLHKSFWRGTKCSLIFGLAQIWTGTKHFGTCKGQIILKAIFVFLTSSKKRTKKIWHDMIWPLKGQGNSVHDFTLDLIPVKILNLITCNLCSVLYCTFRKRFIILRFGCYAVIALHSSLHFHCIPILQFWFCFVPAFWSLFEFPIKGNFDWLWKTYTTSQFCKNVLGTKPPEAVEATFISIPRYAGL